MSETTTNYVPRLRKQYNDTIVKGMMESGKYKNPMQVPKMEKIVLSFTSKDCVQNPKSLDGIARDIGQIVGQKVKITKSKKAVSNFKLRANLNLGCVVTLRNDRMWEFLDRFIAVACPRIRDFRGFPTKSFDGRGNYSLGIKEHTIFPEVDYNKVEKIRGFNITFGTSAKTDEQARDLLNEFSFPFKKPMSGAQ